MYDPIFIKTLHFCFDPKQRRRFTDGRLGEEWRGRYPDLFDDKDVEIYRNQCRDGYHFFEWLGAILLYEATGYRSLVEKYGSKGHPRKSLVYDKLAPDWFEEMDDSGWPDLFCYTPDLRDWHLCEVKGASDKLRPNQMKTFRKLYEKSGKKVLVLSLKQVDLSS